VAGASGGRYLPPDEVARLKDLLHADGSEAPVTELRDLWHNVWTLLAIMGLLALEWVARRRVGLA
jgi:hypothetical protein